MNHAKNSRISIVGPSGSKTVTFYVESVKGHHNETSLNQQRNHNL